MEMKRNETNRGIRKEKMTNSKPGLGVAGDGKQ